MKREFLGRKVAAGILFALVAPVLAACGGTAAPAAPVRETVVVTSVVAAPTQPAQQVVVTATADPNATAVPTAAPAEGGAFTTPHPILGDLKVRQAIAFCTNRLELIKSVYGYLNDDEQKKLLMDSFVPQGHWALAKDGLTTYPFNPDEGKKLLDAAGWTVAADAAPGTVRAKDGVPLFMEFTTTNAGFRQTWATVLEQQLKDNCGIQISRKHAPGSWWFGDTTGLARRDFEIGAFAWVGSPDPGGQTLYACNQIPLPSNNWEGQNSMGWCNEKASAAIIAANNTLDRAERVKQYAIFQQEFTKDMVSLPLFNRLEAAAANKNLENFKPNSTEYVTANAGEWKLKSGGDSVVMGFTQEPASLFTLVESAAVAVQVGQLITALDATAYDYDYQAVGLKQLPKLDNGGATNSDVDVKEGDMIWGLDSKAVKLEKGVKYVGTDGQTATYDSGTVKMKQLAVTFEHVDGLKWSDGKPVVKADYELAAKITCDKDSGATSFTTCESYKGIEYKSDTSYTITYLPGAQWPQYYVQSLGAYPAHQMIESEGAYKGKTLADVPAKDWATLTEVAEKPLSSGPYMIESWEKGQRMVLKANPNYFKGEPAVKTLTIQFISDTQQAVAQLLTGDVDVLDPTTLGAGEEVATVLKAAQEGKIQAVTIASPTWEHMDYNLFLR